MNTNTNASFLMDLRSLNPNTMTIIIFGILPYLRKSSLLIGRMKLTLGLLFLSVLLQIMEILVPFVKNRVCFADSYPILYALSYNPILYGVYQLRIMEGGGICLLEGI